VVQAGAHLLACMRHVELNPVRAGLVRHPRDWQWSSHRANAEDAGDGLLTPHPTWLALGADDASRRRAYRALVEAAPPAGRTEAIRAATRASAVLGDRRFAIEVEALRARQRATLRSDRT
jgi:putative transposase